MTHDLSTDKSSTIAYRRIVSDGERIIIARGEIGLPPSGHVRVRAEWSQVSIGTEIAWLRENPHACGALGYSHVGIIDAIGDDVVGWRPGQRVLSTSPHASAVHASAVELVGVPDGLNPATAALGVLASVAYHIVERAAPRLLEPAAVIGQGVIGSLVLQLLRASGAEPLIAIDADPARLSLARAIGAIAIDARADVVARVRDATGGAGVALCIEAATSASAFATALAILALRGRLVATSTLYRPVEVRVVEDLVERELTILGAHQPKCPLAPNAYHPWTQLGNRAASLRALADHRLRADGLVSHRVTADDAPALYARMIAGDRSITGVLIDWRVG